MDNKHSVKKDTIYRIEVQGQLESGWTDWFDGMALSVETTPGGDIITTLSGPVSDQAALRGILNKLWDLNLTLISTQRILSS